MKHGDKAKAKSAKASSKASDKKASKPAQAKRGAATKSRETKGSKPQAARAAEARPSKSVVPKRAVQTTGNGGASPSRGVAVSEPASFGNAVVAAAFRRAVKKYPNAFRRLTD